MSRRNLPHWFTFLNSFPAKNPAWQRLKCNPSYVCLGEREGAQGHGLKGMGSIAKPASAHHTPSVQTL